MVVLSTDAVEIADSAAGTRVRVPFLRPRVLAQDNTPTSAVISHLINYFDVHGEVFDNIILLQPTCPFRPDGFVDKCIEHFVATGADSLISVRKVPHEYNPHWAFEENEEGFLRIATGESRIITSRQMLPPAFVRDGSVYVFKADNVRYTDSMYGKNIAMLEATSNYHVNIDTPDNWRTAEIMASAMEVRERVER